MCNRLAKPSTNPSVCCDFLLCSDPDSDLAENENKDQNGTDDAMDDFLDMDLGSQCFPPLASLPQGTDIEAFAQCMEDFQDSAY